MVYGLPTGSVPLPSSLLRIDKSIRTNVTSTADTNVGSSDVSEDVILLDPLSSIRNQRAAQRAVESGVEEEGTSCKCDISVRNHLHY